VILQNINDESAAEMVARKMLVALSDPFKAENLDIEVHPEIKIYTDTEGYNELDILSKGDIYSAYLSIHKTEVLNSYDKVLDR